MENQKIKPIERHVMCCPGDCLTIFDDNQKAVAAIKVDTFCELHVQISPSSYYHKQSE